MKQRFSIACAYLASISAILILLITSIQWNCFDRGFYEREYESMNTAASLHMSHEDLMKATETLLDYLEDTRDDVSVTIDVYELPREAFNERESLHMVDVKALYQFALHVRVLAIIVLVASFAWMWADQKKTMWKFLSIAFVQCAVSFLCLLAFLGMWAAIDFTSLWESFHHLFFRNDLWLLNPRTDLMINMFPEDFFFHMVLRIAWMFIIGFSALLGASLWCLFFEKTAWLKKATKEEEQ